MLLAAYLLKKGAREENEDLNETKNENALDVGGGVISDH